MIRKPPFYALLGTMGTDGINIGVEVNSNLEVKKKDGGIVPGLYAVGDNSAGWYLGTRGVGDHPDHLMSDLSWAFASGFAVADSVKNYLK